MKYDGIFRTSTRAGAVAAALLAFACVPATASAPAKTVPVHCSTWDSNSGVNTTLTKNSGSELNVPCTTYREYRYPHGVNMQRRRQAHVHKRHTHT